MNDEELERPKVPERPEPNTTEIWDGGTDGGGWAVVVIVLLLAWWLSRCG